MIDFNIERKIESTPFSIKIFSIELPYDLSYTDILNAVELLKAENVKPIDESYYLFVDENVLKKLHKPSSVLGIPFPSNPKEIVYSFRDVSIITIGIDSYVHKLFERKNLPYICGRI